MNPPLQEFLAQVQEEDLRRWVAEFSGLRHGQLNSQALEEKGERLAERLREFGLPVQREPFRYRGRPYFNVVAPCKGQEDSRPAFLIGAHYDAMMGSPGADDNASGVAALLGVAKVFSRINPGRTVEFIGFTLEEPQGQFDGRFRHGSRRFARQARRNGKRYEGIFILESVGYTDTRFGSQRVPLRVAVPVPDAGTFLCVAGSRRSRALMRRFGEAARAHVPGLSTISYAAPLRGWLIPMIRWSDHAPFWDRGFSALMLTDTAPLRNPHYHQPTDLPETLDYTFLTNVTRALVAALLTPSG
ncbi:MAG: M28 family peptidase [Nitrospinota bacterium]